MLSKNIGQQLAGCHVPFIPHKGSFCHYLQQHIVSSLSINTDLHNTKEGGRIFQLQTTRIAAPICTHKLINSSQHKPNSTHNLSTNPFTQINQQSHTTTQHQPQISNPSAITTNNLHKITNQPQSSYHNKNPVSILSTPKTNRSKRGIKGIFLL